MVGDSIETPSDDWGIKIPQASLDEDEENLAAYLANGTHNYTLPEESQLGPAARKALQALGPDAEETANGILRDIERRSLASPSYCRTSVDIGKINVEYEMRGGVCEGFKMSASGSTMFPKGSELVELKANLEIDISDTSKPVAQGCFSADLNCERNMEKVGVGWAADAVCPRIYFGGRICAFTEVGRNKGSCRKRYLGWEKYYPKVRYCKRRSWFWCWGCCSYGTKRSSWPWYRRLYEEDTIKPIAVVGGRGTVYAGLDLWAVGCEGEAVIQIQKPVFTSYSKYDNTYMGIYVKVSGWVLWSSFDASFALVPWGNNQDCGRNNIMMNGVHLKKI